MSRGASGKPTEPNDSLQISHYEDVTSWLVALLLFLLPAVPCRSLPRMRCRLDPLRSLRTDAFSAPIAPAKASAAEVPHVA